MKIKPYGDGALLVEFDETIDLAVSEKVMALYHGLQQREGIKFLIPAYHSLTIGFDHSKWVKEIYQYIENFDFSSKPSSLPTEIITIPVCYNDALAIDMAEVVSLTGLTKEQIIEMHCASAYHIFMLGFLAGFAYMGKTPKALYCPRKASPRLEVPQGAVGLAGNQTGVYPTAAPGGWQIIGQTPVPLFDPLQSKPALLKPGTMVKFRPISFDEYQLIEIKVTTGIYQAELNYAST